MIIFEKIRWKNLLSTGNHFTEVDFTRSPNTLIIGENGAGKSTILDALCFVLFDKPFRKVKKGQLINSINERDCKIAWLRLSSTLAIGNTRWCVGRNLPSLKSIRTANYSINLGQSEIIKTHWKGRFCD